MQVEDEITKLENFEDYFFLRKIKICESQIMLRMVNRKLDKGHGA